MKMEIILILLLAISIIINIILCTDNNNKKHNKTVKVPPKTKKDNTPKLKESGYIYINEYKITFTSCSVYYQDMELGSYFIDSKGYTNVITRPKTKIRYKIENIGFNSTATFINDSKNNILKQDNPNIEAKYLFGPKVQIIHYDQRHRICYGYEYSHSAEYNGDVNGAIAAFVCAHTDLITDDYRFHKYFTL